MGNGMGGMDLVFDSFDEFDNEQSKALVDNHKEKTEEPASKHLVDQGPIEITEDVEPVEEPKKKTVAKATKKAGK